MGTYLMRKFPGVRLRKSSVKEDNDTVDECLILTLLVQAELKVLHRLMRIAHNVLILLVWNLAFLIALFKMPPRWSLELGETLPVCTCEIRYKVSIVLKKKKLSL